MVDPTFLTVALESSHSGFGWWCFFGVEGSEGWLLLGCNLYLFGGGMLDGLAWIGLDREAVQMMLILIWDSGPMLGWSGNMEAGWAWACI